MNCTKMFVQFHNRTYEYIRYHSKVILSLKEFFNF